MVRQSVNVKQLDYYMSTSRVVWEGWTVQNFIDELEPQVDMIMRGESWRKPFTAKSELKSWCMDNQPYYKKYIPEVVTYFSKKYNLK